MMLRESVVHEKNLVLSLHISVLFELELGQCNILNERFFYVAVDTNVHEWTVLHLTTVVLELGYIPKSSNLYHCSCSEIVSFFQAYIYG